MRSMMIKKLKCKKGQGMVEYGILIALIAVALIAAITPLRDAVITTFQDATTALTGGTAAPTAP